MFYSSVPVFNTPLLMMHYLLTGDCLTEKNLNSGSSITTTNSRNYLEVLKKTTKESVKTGGIWATICNKKLLDATTVIVFCWHNSLQWARASSFTRFLDHTQRRTTVGRTPLDEWSARRRDLWQHTTHTTDIHPCHWWDSNPQSQQTSGYKRLI